MTKYFVKAAFCYNFINVSCIVNNTIDQSHALLYVMPFCVLKCHVALAASECACTPYIMHNLNNGCTTQYYQHHSLAVSSVGL